MDFSRIMKQPDLGKKITELRKAKGLTQEELVDKCNLNVRTLRRIEAGEVTPRTYTIRTIFAALDFSIPEILESQMPGDTTRSGRAWAGQLVTHGKDLFNLRTNTMRKISILTVSTGVIAFGFVTVFSEGRAQSPEKVKQIITDNSKHFLGWFNDKQLDSLASLYDENACLVGYGCGMNVVRQHYGGQMQ